MTVNLLLLIVVFFRPFGHFLVPVIMLLRQRLPLDGILWQNKQSQTAEASEQVLAAVPFWARHRSYLHVSLA